MTVERSPRDPLAIAVSLALLRAARVLVPIARRRAWSDEWEAEIRHRWGAAARRGAVPLGEQVDLVRRSSGSFVDAAWLRRQFTTDAECVHDVRDSVRLLVRHPRFAVASIVTLALGIGAATTVFSVVDAALLKPLPFREPERLVRLWERRPADGRERDQIAAATFADWREEARSFTGLTAWISWDFALRDGAEPVAILAARVSTNLFRVLGVQPALGRDFLPEEEEKGRERVAVLSHGLWRGHFGGDPGVVGRTVSLDDESYVIVGVMPEGFRFPEEDPGLWVPLAFLPHEVRARSKRMFSVIGRLSPGVDLPEARAEMSVLASRLAAEHPASNRGWEVEVAPAVEVAREGARGPLLSLLAAVGLVLLIACANVSSLLLARGAARRQELSVRSALGASRTRLLRYLLTEALVLAGIGGALGVTLAHGGVRAARVLGAAHLPPWNPVALDGGVLAFALASIAFVSVLSGLAPGLTSIAQLGRESVRSGRPGAAGVRTGRLTYGVVVVETALCIVLLVGAGLLVRSLVRVLEQDPGFRPDGIVSASIFLPDKRYPEDAQQVRFFDQLLERVRQLPGVESVGATTTLPMNRVGIDHDMPFAIEGTASLTADPPPEADFRIASDDYFRTMRIPVLAGRSFLPTDDDHGRRVAIISRATSERYLPGQDPVGRTLYWGSSRRNATEIVGVVGEVRHRGLETSPRPEMYLPFRQISYGSLVVVARTSGDAEALGRLVAQQVLAIDPALPVSDVSTMEDLLSTSLAGRRLMLAILGSFAAFALLLAATGVYGVVSFTTARRTHEFGVRVALGARARDLEMLVLRDTLAHVAVGAALGVPAALAAALLLRKWLFQVGPADPLTLVAVVGVLGSVALGCSLPPARRATRVDPTVALRGE